MSVSSELDVENLGGQIPQPHYRTLDDERLSAEEMDEKRKQNMAYEYLCHLEEAKKWMEACTDEELPTTTELEEGLRNGVYLAKLAHFFAPNGAKSKRIYDKEQTRYKATGLHFRHTDNINHWLTAMEEIGLPSIFYPETTDIYDKKNVPRAIYCVHALSLYLFKLGLAPQIQDLYGKINFTEEEISNMRKELEKYGIQMPSFGKIGGILANEMSVDDAALHAAIIAINDAIDRKDAPETMKALQNPAAMLVNCQMDFAETYQTELWEAKQTKAENSRNKFIDPNSTYEADVYDELLTQAEIQGYINQVNVYTSLSWVNDALQKMDRDSLINALTSGFLSLKNVNLNNIDFYMKCLQDTLELKKNNNGGDVFLDKDEVQAAINLANQEADVEYQKQVAVKNINLAIENTDAEQLMKALQNPAAQLSPIDDTAPMLYCDEFCSIRQEKQDSLEYHEIFNAVKILSAIAAINSAVDRRNSQATFTALSDPNAHIPTLDFELSEKYQNCLAKEKQKKFELPCEQLTHHEIVMAVEKVHQQVQQEHERVCAIGTINDAISNGDEQAVLAALQLPAAQLQNVRDRLAHQYMVMLVNKKNKKALQSQDEDTLLWLEEIQETIVEANEDEEKAVEMSLGIKDINANLNQDSSDVLLQSLQCQPVQLQNLRSSCGNIYMEKLRALRSEKETLGETGTGWMMNRSPEGFKFFYNVNTGDYAWVRNDTIIKDYSILTKEEIQSVLTEIQESYDRELLFKANEGFIVLVQALIRGYLVRKSFNDRITYINSQTPAITKIQAYWRGSRQRNLFKTRKQFLKQNGPAAVKLQAFTRMYLTRKRYRERLKYFKDNENSIVKIQAFVRSTLARHDYKSLVYDDNPPLSVVRKFVHLLDASDADYAEELELQKLRQQVGSEIRSNQQLENDLNQMDIKIGLLIKNRITLQDVVFHNHKLKKHAERTGAMTRGLKALSKESRGKLDAYQHLFYLLQTNPTYLAKLIFEMPQSKTTKFMESVIFSLFNYGSNAREEFLLLRLFKTALEEEITRISKVDKMSDIVTGNPMIIKMIVGFNRNPRGQSALRDLLHPLIKEVLDDKEFLINTNPVEVYKSWINQTESQTGQASGLAYNVTSEQAMKHSEVKSLIQESIVKLQKATDKFLITITQSLDKIPYGMRYMAKVLKAALWKKFPLAPEKDVLKIVGNLIYYRYINSAIVAPDAFDIIDVGANKALSADQRRNLGSIAKILQFAASNKGFAGDSSHLSCMNDYIREAHKKFKNFFQMACEVEDLENKFNIDQYTDATMVSKPVIYMSVQEICDTHQLLLKHQDTIAPDHNDSLHELLEDLGECPTVDALLGAEINAGGEDGLDESVRAQLAKTEITLTLMNKFEVPDDDMSDIKGMMIRTKKMIVDVIACQSGETLSQILEVPSTDEQEDIHQALIKKRDMIDKKASNQGKLERQTSLLGDNRLPLEMMKGKIKKNLQNLELANLVTRKNKYQDIINSIARDIRNQRRYRNTRRQELIRLRSAVKSLHNKRAFYEEQIDYYNLYVKTCLDNMAHKENRKSRSFTLFRKDDNLITVKYSAAQLYEKGLILEIEDLAVNQFKNVLFEISNTEKTGVFEVNAKFLGVHMEKVELVFQDLLQLQYEGVAVMNMFNRAKVNVNLLIFLLNRKFYGR
ncbi:ras GTPase-activating-like protein IQGAP1 isoform X1 [Octopus sinensis]|uniref:Ras GTPase-activating-like protein IQGAP1 isoform X1 n=1 Tax=Octopus sinensis TaxID=2607531 RepID=A0A6P7U8J2_9MOLL|nr:ras GTPase-activating-like protein IQGAP1 isoform X1 [Octopus sinensis]